jgi:hypothetical protein
LANDNEMDLPPGVKLVERDDGMTELVFSKDSGITIDSLSKSFGGELRYLDAKKRKRAVMWVPFATPEHEARAAELSGLLSKVVGRIRSGEISGESAEEIGALIAWLAQDMRRQSEARRHEVFSLVSATAEIDTESRRKGARGKLEKNAEAAAKSAAKKSALVLWQERRHGQHPKLRTVEQFAIEVMRRWPILTSPKVICGWSSNWTKAIKKGRIPVC